MIGFRGAFGLALAAALFGPSAAFASSGGITGVSGSPGDGFATCSGCHGGGAQTGSIAINGSGTVAPSSFTGYSVSLTGSNAATAGYNLSATAGTLTASTNSQASGGQVTHSAEFGLSSGALTWFFNWTAPSTIGTRTMYVCVNRTNNNNDTTGDSPTCTSRSITVNTSPNAVNDTAGVLEGSTNTCISVLSNDTSGASGNESGDSISLFSVGTPNQGGSAVIGGGSCTASQVRYSPATNFFGTESFSYTIRDAFGSASFQDTAMVTVTVTGVNDAPTLNAIGNASINEDPGLQTVNLAGISAGPGESQTLTVTASSDNTAVIPDPTVTYTSPNATGSISYTPVANASGSAVVTVTVTDNGGTANGGVNSFSRNFTVTVSAVNDAPDAVDDTPGIAKNSTGNTIDVLVNDSDVDSALLTITGVGTPSAGGSVIIQGVAPNQSLSYSPATNYSGPETFDYTISDGLLTDTATVTVTVSTGAAPTPLDDGPFAVDEDSTANVFDVLANDTDPDVGDTLAVTQVNGSASFPVATTNGSVSLSGAGPGNTLLYTPNADHDGADSFTYTVQDAGGLTAVATVSVNASGVNDAPSISAPATIGVTEDTVSPLTGISFADVDAGSGALVATVSVASGTLAATSGGGVTVGGSPISRTLSGTLANLNAFVAGSGLGFTTASDNTGDVLVGVTLSDGGNTGSGGTAVATPVNVTLTVTAVNDAPQITSNAITTAEDSVPYSYQVTVSDVDDANDGSALAWSLPTAPAGMTVSNTGLIQWTPPVDFAGSEGVTVQVADGGEDGAAPAMQSFTINVSVPDSDGDGMPDSFENLHGFDPDDPSDAAEDADGDGDTNLQEYQNGTDPTVDDIAPVLTVPPDLVVPATGYVTFVDLGTATAIDGKDGPLTPVSDWDTFPVVRPGRYVVTWSAQDQAGNLGTATQNVDVLPLADFNADQASGEGRVVNVTVTLNGTPPEYPVAIPYAVSGTAGAADSDAAPNGTLTITSGLSVTVPVAITADGLAEGAEQLVFTMSTPDQAAAGSRTSHTITITDGNVAPVVALSGFQGAFPRLTAYQGDGLFTLDALASDPNDDALTYDWSGSADALGLDGAATSQVAFDPSGLAAGAYPVAVSVSDGSAPTAATLLVVVAAGTSADVDIDSDGIPDSVDSVTDYGALLEDQAGDPATAELIEATPGVSLRRGRTSMAAGRTGALVSMSDIVTFGVGGGGIALGADSFDNLGGIFDFEVHGVAAGGTAQVVLPLQTAIREGAVYRKFDPVAGWHDFVVDADNAVASANANLGQCPGPNSAEYVAGLQPFAECVRLTLEDGGPNDADGTADGVIRDPGGVAITVTPDTGATVKVSSGAFLALLLPLAALLRLRRAGAALLALAALLAALPARAEHHIRIHYSGDVATGFDDNVTNAQQDADIRESGFTSVNGNVEYQRSLSLYTTLLLRGSAQYEYWSSFDGLNNAKATGMARMLYRGDGDFFTPTYAGWVSVAGLEFDSAIRDGVEYRAGAFITENLTTQLTGRFALMANRREAAGEVFDIEGYSASLNLDWVPAPRMTVYTGFQFYDGGVASTATPTVWVVNAAEAIEADDAFGGLGSGLFAYRLDAQAGITTLGFNYAFSRKMSADLQGQYISTRADSRNQYERMVGVVSLLARF